MASFKGWMDFNGWQDALFDIQRNEMGVPIAHRLE